MVNRVILIGNLGSDPEIRSFENGSKVARFSLATSESYRDRDGQWQDRTEWHDVVSWRVLADRAEQSLRKGMQVYVEGKLIHRTWEDKDGNKRKTTEVEASYFRIVNRRDAGASGMNQTYSSPPSGTTQNTPSQVVSGEPSGTEPDDLPF